MTITFSRADAAKAAAFAVRAIAPRPAVPVLHGMQISPTEGGFTLSATDYDTSASAFVAASAELAEALVLPGRLFTDWVTTTRGDVVTLTVDGTRAKLSCGGASITVTLLKCEDFPNLPPQPEPELSVRRDLLTDALVRIAPMVSTDRLHPLFFAVRLLASDGELVLTGTNRYVMGQLGIRCEGDLKEALPEHRHLADLAPRLDGDEVGLAVIGGLLHISGATMRASLRMIDSQDFDWSMVERAIDRHKAHANPATVDAEALRREASTVAKLSGYVGGRANYLQLTITNSQAVVGLRDEIERTAELASAPVEWLGADGSFAINSAYLLASLAVVGTPRVQIAKSDTSPAHFSSPDSTGIALAMPLRY